MKIHEMEGYAQLPSIAKNALAAAGIQTKQALNELIERGELGKLPNVGKKSELAVLFFAGRTDIAALKQPPSKEMITVNEAARRIGAVRPTLVRAIKASGTRPDGLLVSGGKQVRSAIFHASRLPELKALVS